MPTDAVTDLRGGAAACAAKTVVGVDVSGLGELPGLADLPVLEDGTVDAVLVAGLAATLDPCRLETDAQVLEVAALWDRLTCWTQAMHLAAVAELCRRPDEPGAPARRLGPFTDEGELVRPHTAEEVAAAVGLSVRSAEHRVWTAIPLCTTFRGAWAALASGRIDYPRANAMVDEAAGVHPAVVAEVEQRVLRGGRRGSSSEFVGPFAAQCCEPMRPRLVGVPITPARTSTYAPAR
jgi:hypothetical protein